MTLIYKTLLNQRVERNIQYEIEETNDQEEEYLEIDFINGQCKTYLT